MKMRSADLCRHALAACALAAHAAAGAQAARHAAGRDLSQLSLEDLGNVQVSSVSRRLERLADAAAAVYVITREDIRRSGYLTLPDILRLAPNLFVARQDAGQYAITARGFNSTTANKLLVLIDGRSVYTPLFSGVFWDTPDLMIDDIERVEVVSGPGGTLWGANAVNGVINVITRSSRDTDGGYASVAAGSDERRANARWGRADGEGPSFRVYGKTFRRDASLRASGASARDDIRKSVVGFRADGRRADDSYTVQGDVYEGSGDQPTGGRRRISGGNLLARWNHEMSGGSDLQVQAYYDLSRRDHPGTFAESLHTWDVDVQHHFEWGERHRVLWGGGWRHARDEVSNSATIAFLPARQTLTLANVFAQDTIRLADRLHLTLGAKLERNNYTGWEAQPNARLAWQAAPDSLLWTAVSRAVRTPSRLDRELFSPGAPPFVLAGGPGFRSEKLTALELGWRAQPTPRVSYTLAAYWHRYDDLRSLESMGPGLPLVIGNGMEGRTHGVEAWGTWRVSDAWRLSAGANWMRKDLRFKPGSNDVTGLRAAGNDPDYQIMLRSSTNLGAGMTFDVNVRAVGPMPNPAVPSYVALDLRWAWQFRPDVELSLTALNLDDRSRPEFGSPATRGEVPRSWHMKIEWRLP